MPLQQSISRFRANSKSQAASDALFADIFSIVHRRNRTSLGVGIRKCACRRPGFNRAALTPNQQNDLWNTYPNNAAGDQSLFWFITRVILKKKKSGSFGLQYRSDSLFVVYVAQALVDEVQNDFPDELYPSFEIEPPCSRGSAADEGDIQAYKDDFEARLLSELNAMNNNVSPMYKLALYCDYANNCWKHGRNVSADVSNKVWSSMGIAANLGQADIVRVSQLAKAQHGAAIWMHLAALAGLSTDHFRREAKKTARRLVNMRDETFTKVVDRCNAEAIGSVPRLYMS